MDDYAHEKEVIDRLRQRFPDESMRTDEWMVDRWDTPDEAPHV
ncbi:hypothetical protein [Ramlibacter tataouinensis]|nr:hypothetical protein [Ramlibacter tataouinensis]